MIGIKKIGLAGIAITSLGASGVYFAMMMARDGRLAATGAGVNGVVVALLAAMNALALLAFYRSVRSGVGSMTGQLRNMTQTDEIGLLLPDGCSELAEISQAINELLTASKVKIDEHRAENRELHIHSRIAAAEKQHTEAIIFSISDAVIVTNRFDELMLANEAAEKLLDFKLDKSLRKNIEKVIDDSTLVGLIRKTRSHGRNGNRKVVEHEIVTRGERRTFNVTLSCVFTHNKEVSGSVAVLQDVTREREIARMKTDFVSNVSHELKTPLSSIKAYIEMLLDGEAEDVDTRREFHEIISAETDRLHRLIENILNISRIESGVVKVVREPISLASVVKQVLDVAAPQAMTKNIEITERLSPIYYQIEADHDMIYQAVLNLVSNAIKYTTEGGKITVSVTVDEQREVAICEIADTGVGIPTDDLPHIFDKFYRVRANNKIGKGTGLGLTLTKHMIETVHDGKLSVSSKQGEGSAFAFELPLLQ